MAFVKDGTPFLNYDPHMRLQMIKKLNGLELRLSDLKKEVFEAIYKVQEPYPANY